MSIDPFKAHCPGIAGLVGTANKPKSSRSASMSWRRSRLHGCPPARRSGALDAPDASPDVRLVCDACRLRVSAREHLAVGSKALDLHLLAADLVLDRLHAVCADLLQRHLLDNACGLVHQSMFGGLDNL